MNHRPLSKILLFGLLSAWLTSSYSKAVAQYIYSQGTSQNSNTLKKPLWSIPIDNANYRKDNITATKNALIIKQGGIIKSIDLATGKILWQGKKVAAFSGYINNTFLANQQGSIVAYNALSGKELWRKKGELVNCVTTDNSTFYITLETQQGVIGYAIDSLSNKIRWEIKDNRLNCAYNLNKKSCFVGCLC